MQRGDAVDAGLGVRCAQQLVDRVRGDEPAEWLRIRLRRIDRLEQSHQHVLLALGDLRADRVARLRELAVLLLLRLDAGDAQPHARHQAHDDADGRQLPPRQLHEPGEQHPDAGGERPGPRPGAEHQPGDDDEPGERDVPAAQQPVEAQDPQHDQCRETGEPRDPRQARERPQQQRRGEHPEARGPARGLDEPAQVEAGPGAGRLALLGRRRRGREPRWRACGRLFHRAPRVPAPRPRRGISNAVRASRRRAPCMADERMSPGAPVASHVAQDAELAFRQRGRRCRSCSCSSASRWTAGGRRSCSSPPAVARGRRAPRWCGGASAGCRPGGSSGAPATASGPAAPGSGSRRRRCRTGARPGWRGGTGTAARFSSPATA